MIETNKRTTVTQSMIAMTYSPFPYSSHCHNICTFLFQAYSHSARKHSPFLHTTKVLFCQIIGVIYINYSRSHLVSTFYIQGTHSNCIFKFPCFPCFFPVPIYVICDYYIHKTDLADLSSFPCVLARFSNSLCFP